MVVLSQASGILRGTHRDPRLSSAIPLLTSLHSTTALSGGFRYSPTTSVSRGLPMKPGGRPAHLCPECAETPTSPASFHCSCRCHSTALPEQPRRRGQLAGQPDAARVGGQAGLDARGACGPAANRSLDGLRGEADDAVGRVDSRRAILASARTARATLPLTKRTSAASLSGLVLLRRTATSRPPSSRASVTSRHSSSTASERRSPPMKSSPTMTRSTAPRSAASSVDSRPPRTVGRREDGRQVSRPSRVRPDRAGRIRFAGQPDAEPSRRDRHRGARGADGYPGGNGSTRRGGSPGSSRRGRLPRC